MKVTAIIPAAGAGIRLGKKTAKPYLILKNKPLLIHSLLILEKISGINQIIVVAEKTKLSRVKKIVERFRISKVKAIVAGGITRSESVQNGLKFVEEDTNFVLIHDAARPFVTKEIINKTIQAAVKYKAAVCAVPCVSTIKMVNKNLEVITTLDRTQLWQIQTPQVFAYKLIKKAYEKIAGQSKIFFDDASLIEQLPHKVKIVVGSDVNMKITTKEDFKIAQALTGKMLCG